MYPAQPKQSIQAFWDEATATSWGRRLCANWFEC